MKNGLRLVLSVISILIFLSTKLVPVALDLEIVSICPEEEACLGLAKHFVTVLDGAPPYTFEWSNGQTDENVDSSFAYSAPEQILSVKVTDQNLDTLSRQISFNCPQIPSFEVALDRNCLSIDCESFMDVTVTPFGGTAPFTFVWGENQAESGSESSRRIPFGSTLELLVTDATSCQLPLAIAADSCSFDTQPLGLTFAIQNTDCAGAGGRLEPGVDGRHASLFLFVEYR